MKSFEEYLEGVCFEENPTVSKEIMPGFFFRTWLEEQTVESILIYSEGWGRHIKNTILKEVTNLTK